MNTLQLDKGRESSLLRHHPWIFSGAVKRVSGDPQPGETVKMLDSGGNVLGYAAYSPSSQIRARLWTHQPKAVIDEAFIRERVQRAIERR
ncbi:MAG TPA: 23S rRNA (cytosine(1962)-C(5))-methyltransferase RlmI, partial [Pseudohongiella sp.]|nr:23S rRNA (cytosine(1962)-C(5))-methyltransferase RlmI [Pseudohongiella sp.]